MQTGALTHSCCAYGGRKHVTDVVDVVEGGGWVKTTSADG